jgi:hypothetical protein
MKHQRPIHSQHRIQRLALWTLAMLHWIAATLLGKTPNARHRAQRGDFSLHRLKRMVIALVMLRAAHVLGPQRSTPAWRHGRDLRRRHFIRSLLGSKLRRALNHRDLATHIAQLIAVLCNLNTHAARLAFRIRHRLRRLWRLMPPIAPNVAVHGAPASPPAFSDSS